MKPGVFRETPGFALKTAQLQARGARVRIVMSTGDVNVVKSVRHDPMIVKFRTSELVSELVHEGIGHFDQAYWNAQDIVNFFENANE